IEDGKFLYVNDRLAQVLGFKNNDQLFSQVSCIDVVGLSEYHKFLESFQNGMLKDYEIEYTTQSGLLTWINISASMYSEFGYIEGFILDITAKKFTEKALRESEQQLQNIINFLPDATLVIDNDGVITAWNKSAEDMLGYTSVDMVGKGNYEYALPFFGFRRPILIDLVLQDDENVVNQYLEIRRIGNFLYGEIYCPKIGPSGAILWGVAAPLYDTMGNKVGAIECIRDTTERRKAEEALKESEEIQRTITSTASDAIITMDNEGLVTFWNSAATNMFGYTMEEAIGQDLHALVAPHSFYQNFFDGFSSFKKTGLTRITDKPLELLGRHKDGHEFPIELNLATFMIRTELFINGIVRDISLRKLVERELQQALVVAEVANKTKTQFLANVSHEIRTPLTAIIGMMELLSDTPLNEVQKDWTNSVLDSSFHLLDIINGILDLSKIEAGKLTINEQPFELEAVLKRAIGLGTTKIRQKNVELTYQIDSVVPEWLMGDQLRLIQVLINLINNAVKFTDLGQITVRVSVASTIGPKLLVHFEVIDTGIGIAEEDQQKLFSPFNQVDNSNTRMYGGTGLGLVISSNLVSLMGGSIGFDSELGKGSTFWFTIPFRFAASQKDQEREIPERVSKNRKLESSDVQLDSGESKGHVLLVEDDPVCCRVVHLQLLKLGFSVDVASNGEEAIRAIEVSDHALILMDCQMPVMDGFTATKTIRKTEARLNRHVPIIAMTARALDEDRALCTAAGMDDYLSKPVEFDQLSAVVNHWLTQNKLNQTDD
ncbi:MAG: PAS domain S-box protein, partial [Ignavibacteriales bacterium]